MYCGIDIMKLFLCKTHNCHITTKTCLARLRNATFGFTHEMRPDMIDSGRWCWECELGKKLAKENNIENPIEKSNSRKKKEKAEKAD